MQLPAKKLGKYIKSAMFLQHISGSAGWNFRRKFSSGRQYPSGRNGPCVVGKETALTDVPSLAQTPRLRSPSASSAALCTHEDKHDFQEEKVLRFWVRP